MAPFGSHVLVEKPFAANLAEANRMITALKATGKQLIINWPRRSMGELLCAIEEKREPENSARNNLKILEICFAAIDSADSAQSRVPGKVRSVKH